MFMLRVWYVYLGPSLSLSEGPKQLKWNHSRVLLKGFC